MTATATMSSLATPRRPHKRPTVPLLLELESFPSPPTYIPLTPTVASSPNPPPSRPPSVPLPPVPGPSRISEQDTLLLLSSSRRSSRVSLSSLQTSFDRSRRDSTGSGSGHGPVSPSPLGENGRNSVASFRSTRSIPRSPSDVVPRPSIAFSISEEDGEADPVQLADADVEQLTRMSISPYPLSDLDDDEKILDMPEFQHSLPSPMRASSPPLHARTHRTANESISSIDMLDLPANDDDDDDDGNMATTTTQSARRARHDSVADPIDPHNLHLQMRATRSRSESHRQMLRARSKSPSRALPCPSGPIPPVPSIEKRETEPPPRPVSPDLKEIISATPRPRRKSSSYFSTDDLPQSLSRSRSKSRMNIDRRASDGIAGLRSKGRAESPFNVSKRSERELSWVEDNSFVEDYGIPVPGQLGRGTDFELDPEMEARLERELEGGGSDSDSSIDLHTPLPHLMLRHGLLSPNSKLLPKSLRPNTPQTLPDTRPGSIMSIASMNGSVMTKSGIMKDERDTPMRRTRHRDGRLLRGGIGLTTGLGWSDSEDEDAPSPLTRRLSSLNLSRRSSISSTQSFSSVHPLSRSYSSGTLLEEDDFDNDAFDSAIDEWAAKRSSKTRSSGSRYSQRSLPPTSWQSRQKGRTSTSSTGSTFSLEVTTPEQSAIAPRTPNPSKLYRPISDSHDDMIRTPSTSSTLSIPLPPTPQDEQSTPRLGLGFNKEKSLPPLPISSLRRYPSNLNSGGLGRHSEPRARTHSSASSASSAPSNAPGSFSSSTKVMVSPRPLQLPQAQRQARPSSNGDRPAVPVPSVPTQNLHSQTSSMPTTPVATSMYSSKPLRPRFSDPRVSSALAHSTSATPQELSGSKPKPRTGTGMVYRTSSYAGLNAAAAMSASARPPSRMRMPSSMTSSALSTGSPRAPAVPIVL